MVLFYTCLAHGALYEKGGANGLGARAMGMAGAYSAIGDESAIGWNPAGLCDVESFHIDSSFGMLYDGRARMAGLAAAYPLSGGAVAGLTWQHVFYPQAVEVNADALGFGGSLPLTRDERLSLGGVFRILFGGIRAEGGDFQGLGLDLGLRYALPLVRAHESLTLGLRVQDLDTRLQWANGRQEQIPQSIALGAAYHYDADTLAVLDLERIQASWEETEEIRVLRLGVERWFRKVAGLRAGYLLDNRRTHAFSAGLGFKYAGWELEYALLGPVSDLGFSHRLSLSYGLPVVRPIEPIKPVEAAPAPTPVSRPSAYQLEFVAVPPLFSPNGDGVAETAVFTLRLLQGDRDQVAAWRVSIENQDGTIVRYYDGSGYPETLGWDGRDHKENLCPDGNYVARLLLADAWEKRLAHAEVEVTLQTQLPQILLEAEPEGMIVIAGQPERRLTFRPVGGAGLTRITWQLQIRERQGRNLKTFSGQEALPQEWVWPETGSRQKMPSPGAYEAVLNVRDTAGNRSTDTRAFSVKYLGASVSHGLWPKVFKPGDPKDGKVTFRLNAAPASKAIGWQLTIRDAETERTVATLSGAGAPPATTVWDGRDNQGEWVKGGLYFHSQLRVTFSSKSAVTGPALPLASDVSNQDSGKALALHLTAVAFGNGSAVIPLDTLKNLQQAADTVKRYARRYRVQVKGYTDGQEASGQELALSRKRAQRVLEYLNVSGKIPADALEMVGYGATNPLAPESTASGRAKNRRAEVVLIIQK